ncbi:GerMN domain-containing protein [Heliorestis acidaminivorans]|uniref:GerMN domain-containing protein n=1 Tax=Heliorestis acidaminivorans TaxID=553427 RepID=UPI001478A12D|nr:GerMN domain-containing protein [Heliorestis acidaminivorans]
MYRLKLKHLHYAFLLFLLVLTSVYLAGCANSAVSSQQQEEISSPISEKVVQLYFPDRELNRLACEEYTVSGTQEEKVAKIFEQLKAGPRNEQLITLIPEETILLDQVIEDEDRLTINLSDHIYRINLGSSGEALLVGSIVNSLSALNFTSIQILIDGQIIESIAGHMYIAEPLAFFDYLTIRHGKIPAPSNLQDIQSAVQEGHQLWRLDPVEVSRVDGIALGFSPDKDSFSLTERDSQPGKASVLVTHGKNQYTIHLLQPLNIGPEQIWIIDEVTVE